MSVHYKYTAEDRSVLLKWLTDPVFLPIVRAIPRRITPNQVTWCGHLAVWTIAAIALAGVWGVRATLAALGIAYSVHNLADIVDGQYARYSGRSSALGELFDHGLDPISLGAVVLTYGLVMQEPAWLILTSTATVVFMMFLTYLHGYRIGHVILGEFGLIEGLLVASVLSLAAALGAHGWLTSIAFADVPIAGLVAIAIILGAVPGLLSMRGLTAHLADMLPLLILYAAIGAWSAFGAVDLRIAGLMIVFAGTSQSMIITSSRLRRLPLRLWDAPILTLTVGAAAVSLVLALAPAAQSWLAGVVAAASAARAAVLLWQTVVQVSAPAAAA